MKRALRSPALLAAACSAVLLAAVLMFHPLIGMADNGDFYRTINGQGIYKLDRYEEDQYFSYFSSKYGIYQYYNEGEKSLFSSQNLYIKAALFLNRLFSSETGIFDIRFLSVILMIELVIGIYLMVDYMAWNKSLAQGLVLGGICVFMFADTAYTAYFNSFYGEGIVFVSTLILAASMLLLTQKRYSPALLILSALVNGVILIFTKQQNATEGLPLCLLFLLVAFFFKIDKRPVRNLALLGAGSMAVCGIVMYLIIPEDFVRINQYHAMTRGALMAGDNPEDTLEEFQIDGQYSVLDGSIYYERYPAVEVESGQLVEGFYNKYGFVSLAVHYLTHPGELIVMLDKAAANGYLIRPVMQGNYEREAGRPPGERTSFFTLYSEMKAGYVPNTAGFVLIWMLVACGLGIQNRQKLMILICMIMMGLVQVGTSIIGAGDADLSKHVFMYNVTFDIVSYVSFAPLAADVLLFAGKGVLRFFRKKKGRITAAVVVFVAVNIPMTAYARSSEEKTDQAGTVVIIGHRGEDLSVAGDLARACGLKTVIVTEYEYEDSLKDAEYVITTSALPMEKILRMKIPSVFIGSEFWDNTEYETVRYRNKSVTFQMDGYTGEPVFIEEAGVISAAADNRIGTLLLADGQEYPFAAGTREGNYYIPCFEADNAGARLLLGKVIRQLSGGEDAGNCYFMIDEVYVFSDLNKLCGWADRLYDNGIPFLVRIMPLYDNLHYPAFSRFTQALCYMQSRGGTVLIHDPLVAWEQMEKEPLSVKMARLEQALEDDNVYYRQMETDPYLFTVQDLREITVDGKHFGLPPFDMMIGMTPEFTEEEFEECLALVNERWMSFTDLQESYENHGYLYQEKQIPEDFEYRPREEAAFADFFNASDRFLIMVVGASLVVLIGLLLIGRRWYRRKFFR